MTLKSATTIEPVHPGEILHAEFLKPMEISANKLAKHIQVPTNRVTSIINGQRGISGDTAIRFSHAFGTTPEFWMNLQSHYDLECAKDAANIEISTIRDFAA